MKVYEAEFPAGPLTLGASRDGIQAAKGNYIVAFRPKLLSPDGTVATEESILPLLSEADPERGRDLFFSAQGANCASCHQVDGIGNNHAPDLTGSDPAPMRRSSSNRSSIPARISSKVLPPRRFTRRTEPPTRASCCRRQADR